MTLNSPLRLALLIAPLLGLSLTSLARAETVSVAVAANFTAAAKAIGAAFKAASGDDIAVSSGATGGLYTQISQGAPFQVFLAADSKTPTKAIAEGHAVAGTQFTYAVGKLVLYSAEPGRVTGPEALHGKYEKLAIANPKTAPYGAAAMEVLAKLGLTETLGPKLVTGESIAQTYQFVGSGNAELGFVALSQVINDSAGSQWRVPQEDYTPITQDAVLLTPGAESAAAKAFLDFLRGPQAAEIIAGFGYGSGQ